MSYMSDLALRTVQATVVGVVRAPREIVRQEIDDILVGAFEGGINHWCASASLVSVHTEIEKAGLEWAFMGFAYDIETDEGDVYRLDEERLIDGLQRYVDWASQQLDATEWPDFDNMDAHDYDAIVQFSLFGELVYD